MRRVACFACVLAIGGCSLVPGTAAHSQKQAERLVRLQMRDPASAQFRNESVVHVNGTAIVCGEVNGHNALGGYAGFTRFMVASGSAMLDSGPPAQPPREAGRDVAPVSYEFEDAWRGAECSLPSPSR